MTDILHNVASMKTIKKPSAQAIDVQKNIMIQKETTMRRKLPPVLCFPRIYHQTERQINQKNGTAGNAKNILIQSINPSPNSYKNILKRHIVPSLKNAHDKTSPSCTLSLPLIKS
mmetsp:Transcript_13634/g.24659  ORF Transcript_13634/g.24659 Transcript_13634/m.24659 type:complete len:115 (+) Transcript_13634:103-447(+)